MRAFTSALSRRDFLRHGAWLTAAAATVPSFLAHAAKAFADGTALNDHVLVVVQLSGGNDGLNTVVPFADDAYYRARPTLAIRADEVVRLTDLLGLHPALLPLRALYDDGALAILQSVGYPNPDRSHFRSMEIWQTGEPDEVLSSGWLGRLFDHTCTRGEADPTLAACIDDTLNPAIANQVGVGVALRDPERFHALVRFAAGETPGQAETSGSDSPLDFLRRTALHARLAAESIRERTRGIRHHVAYPDEPFGQSLRLISAMIAGGMPTRIYYASLGGFDTHANQAPMHARLLDTLANGLSAFQSDLRQLGCDDRVVTFTFSEFGRRLAQNGSGGTDHGQAAPLFVLGKPVRGGIIGEPPSLTRLNRGDIIYQHDFRSLYSTLLEEWLAADPLHVLGTRWPRLPLIRQT